MTELFTRSLGITFGAPELLFLAPLSFLLVLLFAWYGLRVLRKLRGDRFVTERTFAGDLAPLAPLAIAKFCLSLALFSFALVLADPIAVTKTVSERKGGVRIAYIVDVSLSMNALDALGENGALSRIDAAKQFLAGTERLWVEPGDRTLPQTVIPFAGNAGDYGDFTESAAETHEMFGVITTDELITAQGSDFAKALATYRDLLDRHPPPPGVTDIAVIISDGGNDPGESTNNIAKIRAEALASLAGRTTIVTVGFGGDEATTIPYYLPNGTQSGVLKKPTDDELKAPPPSLYENGVAEPPAPLKQGVQQGKGDPYSTAFDEEAMAILAADGGRCFRLVTPLPAPTPVAVSPKTSPSALKKPEGRYGCKFEETVPDLVNAFGGFVSERLTPLPPVITEVRSSIAREVLGIGLFFLFFAIATPRFQAFAKGPAERPMRQVLFGDPAD